MIKTYKNKTFKVGRWISKKYMTVKSKKNQFYDYLQENIANGNFSPDENTVEYFNINNSKYTLDDLILRFGICGYDQNCEIYPPEINCILDDSVYIQTLIETDEYCEKIRIWKEI